MDSIPTPPPIQRDEPIRPIEPPKQSKTGCLIAIGAFFFLGIAGMVALIFTALWVWKQIPDLADFVDEPARRASDFQRLELESGDGIYSYGTLQSHPEYDRIKAFVDKMQETLDDTNKPETVSLMDLGLYLEEFEAAAGFEFYESDQELIQHLGSTLSGPSSFPSYEMLAIEDTGQVSFSTSNTFKVYLSCPNGYSYPETCIWWLVDGPNGIKIFDWAELDFGVRSTAERAALLKGTEAEKAGYRKYVVASQAYIDIYAKDLNPEKSRLETIRQIEICEDVVAPRGVSDMLNLITARRWHNEGESDRALNVLSRISGKRECPGYFRLVGEIQFERGAYDAAVQTYKQYLDYAGVTPGLLERFASCYRRLGDRDSEREMLEDLTQFITRDRFAAVGQIMELNKPYQNRALFKRIDQLELRDDLYDFLVARYPHGTYYQKTREELRSHLEQNWPDSLSLMKLNLSDAIAAGNIEELQRLLAEIEAIDGDEVKLSERYDFWSSLKNDQIVPVLQKSENRDVHFESISEYYDFDAAIPPHIMEQICNVVLQSNPQNFKAMHSLGTACLTQHKYATATKSLRTAYDGLPSSNEFKTTVRSTLIRALYADGDEGLAAELAKEPADITQLLDLKLSAKDFSGFDKLVDRLPEVEVGNEKQFYQTVLRFQRGDQNAAIRTLAELVNDSREKDGYSNYKYRSQLIDLCEEQDKLGKAFWLVPTETVFSMLENRLISSYRWDQCEEFLTSKALAEKPVFKPRFEQGVFWAKGEYENIVENSQEYMQMTKSGAPASSDVFDRLIRSAIRIGKTKEAIGFVSSFDSREENYLGALAEAADGANRSKFLGAYIQLKYNDKSKLLDDSGFQRLNWRDLNPPDGWQLRVVDTYFAEPEIDIVMSTARNWTEVSLKEFFGNQFEFESFGTEGWLGTSSGHRIWVTSEDVDFQEEQLAEAEPELKTALRKGKQQIRFMILPDGWASDLDIHNLKMQLIRPFVQDDLCAIGNDNRWMASEEVRRCEAQAGLAQVSRSTAASANYLFAQGKFEGDYFYLSNLPDETDDKFERQFLDVLYDFEKSVADEVELKVAFTQSVVPERIEARVEAIERTSTGYALVKVTVLDGSRFDPAIGIGDQFLVYPSQIQEFEFRKLGEIQKLAKPR